VQAAAAKVNIHPTNLQPAMPQFSHPSYTVFIHAKISSTRLRFNWLIA
jgi:hypothetical protein